MGYCNGLVVFTDYNCYILWNPRIRKTRNIPFPNDPTNTIRRYLKFEGFGFDSVTNEHVLVNVTEFTTSNSVIETVVHLYFVRKRCWRRVHSKPKSLVRTFDRDISIFLNGACFDFGDGLFRNMKIPNYFLEKLPSGIIVDELDGNLVFVGINRVVGYQAQSFSIWVMKEYGVAESWSLLYNIDILEPEGIFIRFVKFKRNGDIIFAKKDVGEEKKLTLIFHDGMTTTESKRYDITGECDLSSIRLDTYVESLVLLGEEEPNERINELEIMLQKIQLSENVVSVL